MFLKTFGGSLAVAVVGLALATLYGGPTGLAVAAILAVLEISLSFDNAVVNATILVRMSRFWQKIFLTVGVAIAVFGMRLIFPLLIVGITAKLTPAKAVHLALEKGSVHTKGSYGYLLHQAHPAIAAFGGVFLLMLFLDFILEEREITWLGWIERPLARIGKLDQLGAVITIALLCFSAYYLAPDDKISTVLLSGSLGLITYILVNGLGELFDTDSDEASDEAGDGADSGAGDEGGSDEAAGSRQGAAVGDSATRPAGSGRATVVLVGKAAFFLFLYLEVLDASFSFDGVVGAFAVTSDPILIAIGLGIGAMFIRSLTVFLVRKGTLNDYVYLEHGALWAIGALAVLLFLTMKWEVPEVVTGLIGVGFIGAAFLTSVVRNRRLEAEGTGGHDDQGDRAVEVARI